MKKKHHSRPCVPSTASVRGVRWQEGGWQVGSSSKELHGASRRVAGAGELLGEQGPSGVWHYGLDKGVRSHAVGHACGCTE